MSGTQTRFLLRQIFSLLLQDGMRVEDDVRIKVNGEVSHHGAAAVNAIHLRYCKERLKL